MKKTEYGLDDNSYDKVLLDQLSSIFYPVNNKDCIRIPEGTVHEIKTASAYELPEKDKLWDILTSSQETLKKSNDVHIHKNGFSELRDDIGKECLDYLQEKAKNILPIDKTGIWNYYL
ncbi:MAG: hypothetical protein M0R51_13170 [Clostridia bacterium]|jgi:hypothetical protein|nr:hypothetical protein [Clostridia bacterium]